MSKAKIISIINYKGGVGKTTSAFNIGVGLNYLNNNKVLLIDLDPQCSLSILAFKAYSRRKQNPIQLNDFNAKCTINSVIKDYLIENRLSIQPKIDLNKLILKNFYTTAKGKNLKNLSIIPATMFDNTDSSYPKGLDDLEIDIASQQMGDDTFFNHLTILAKFFNDTSLDTFFDFIIFDCPPTNNIITQNALIVSDYYLIPTIMDDMSSNGIEHLNNLINKTILDKIFKKYSILINSCDESSYLNYLKKGYPKLLGIFETLKKSGSDTSDVRKRISSRKSCKNKLFDDVIYHHKPTADMTGAGYSCFSSHKNTIKKSYSPNNCYAKLVETILLKTNMIDKPFDKLYFTNKVENTL